jgi:hypothetical protein
VSELWACDGRNAQFLKVKVTSHFKIFAIQFWGGNKYGLMGKKYHENNERADEKGEKERKDKGKEKINDKMTEQEQCS